MTQETAPTPEEARGWLHIMVGRILSSVETTQRDVAQVRDEVAAIREVSSTLRVQVGSIHNRLSQVEKDVTELKQPLTGLHAWRGRVVGVAMAVGGLGLILEIVRNALLIHSGGGGP